MHIHLTCLFSNFPIALSGYVIELIKVAILAEIYDLVDPLTSLLQHVTFFTTIIGQIKRYLFSCLLSYREIKQSKHIRTILVTCTQKPPKQNWKCCHDTSFYKHTHQRSEINETYSFNVIDAPKLIVFLKICTECLYFWYSICSSTLYPLILWVTKWYICCPDPQ